MTEQENRAEQEEAYFEFRKAIIDKFSEFRHRVSTDIEPGYAILHLDRDETDRNGEGRTLTQILPGTKPESSALIQDAALTLYDRSGITIYSYTLTKDVIKWKIPKQRTPQFLQEDTEEERMYKIRELGRTRRGSVASRLLEEQVGENGKPVGTPELRRVIGMIKRATVS